MLQSIKSILLTALVLLVCNVNDAAAQAPQVGRAPPNPKTTQVEVVNVPTVAVTSVPNVHVESSSITGIVTVKTDPDELHAKIDDAKVNEKLAASTERLACWTFVLAALTGIILIANVFLIKEGREQRIVIEELSESIGETAAQNLNGRLPYFFYERAGPSTGTTSRFEWLFGNHHPTVAFLHNVRLGYVIGKPPSDEGFNLVNAVLSPNVVVHTKFAHVTVTLTTAQYAEWQSAVAQSKKLWVFGEISFHDFLDESRTFRFCITPVTSKQNLNTPDTPVPGAGGALQPPATTLSTWGNADDVDQRFQYSIMESPWKEFEALLARKKNRRCRRR